MSDDQAGRAKGETVDNDLLERFEMELGERVPHLDSSGLRVVNPTPLIDLTDALAECARAEFKLDISERKYRVFGKFDSAILGGSTKVRPAVQIIREAIASGKLNRQKTIFEATSGNFGIALGLLAGLGLNVVVLVSRKLQEGVFQELRNGRVQTINLDVDICPAPGLKIDQNVLVAKAVASNLRDQLVEIDLDAGIFDRSQEKIEELLARQDVINLAKLLAEIYGGFCPRQYENDLNVKAHEAVTAPEIDQQLKEGGDSLADFRTVCAFGTGGTSGGIARYVERTYRKKNVHVVFPLEDQDVAGIRTKGKALGLKFYEPQRYSGQLEVDFEEAKRLFRFFASKGYDIGESSALALYAALQMVNYGVGDRFVVIVADGIEKYRKSLGEVEKKRRFEVTLQEASSAKGEYANVLWTHGMFVPKEEGIKLIASSLGVAEDRIKIVDVKDVESIVLTQEIPETVKNLFPPDGKSLLVCMAGGTSLRVAQILAKKGIEAESLTGGIVSMSANSGKKPPELVQVAHG